MEMSLKMFPTHRTRIAASNAPMSMAALHGRGMTIWCVVCVCIVCVCEFACVVRVHLCVEKL